MFESGTDKKVLAYYGLLRVSELTLTKSGHAIKKRNIHTATNKDKILILLDSSKTHGAESRPQSVKISPNPEYPKNKAKSIFCPFDITRTYIKIKGDYIDSDEQFLTFSDRSPVKSSHFRKTLKQTLLRLGLDHTLYDTHSFRIGRATDMMKAGYPIEHIKLSGRRKSNAVFKYIRSLLL